MDFLQIFGNKWLSHSDCAAKNPKIAWSPPLKGITQPDKLKTDQEMKITFFEKSKFLWRHNAILKKDNSVRNVENQKSLSVPPLRGGGPSDFQFSDFLQRNRCNSAICWWIFKNKVSTDSIFFWKIEISMTSCNFKNFH